MKTVFNINNNQSTAASIGRIIEISEEQLAFLYYSTSPLEVQQIKIFTLDIKEGNSHIAAQLEELLTAEISDQSSISKTEIYLNYKELTLVPLSLPISTNGSEVLNFIFGEDKTAVIQNEMIPGTDIKLIYRLPSEVNKVVSNFFPANTIQHSLRKQFKIAYETKPQIVCMVGYSYAKIFVFNNGELLLQRYFHYATADDMAYELLNTCAQLNLELAEVELKLSGFIEINSNLYAALHKYFLNIEFEIIEEALQVKTESEVYPAHLFYPLYQLLPNENN